MKKVPLPQSGAPLYVRLKEALRESMASGMSPGDRLPSESEIVQMYDVSMTTVRLALGALSNEGVIVRKQGKGSFLAQPKQTVPYFGSFTDEMAAKGRTLSTDLVSFEVLEADPRVSTRLGLKRSEPVYKIRRVRLVDGSPLCYQVSYLPAAVLPGLSEADVTSGSLHQRLGELLDGNFDDADEHVEVLLADPYRAELLKIPSGSAVLLIERLLYDGRGVPTELSRSFYGGHAVRLQLRTHLHAAAESPRSDVQLDEKAGTLND